MFQEKYIPPFILLIDQIQLSDSSDIGQYVYYIDFLPVDDFINFEINLNLIRLSFLKVVFSRGG